MKEKPDVLQGTRTAEIIERFFNVRAEDLP